MPVLEYSPPAPPRTHGSPAKKTKSDDATALLQSTRRSPLVSLDPARLDSVVDLEQQQQRMRSVEADCERRRDDDDPDVSMDLARTTRGLERTDGATTSDLVDGAAEGEPIARDDRGSEDSDEDDDDDDDDDDDEADDVPALHIEVRLKANSTLRYDVLRRMLHSHLDDEYETLLTHSEVHDWRDVAVLEQNVERVWIGECALPTQAVPLSSVRLRIYLYQPPSSSNVTEFSTDPRNDDDGDADVPAASVLELPARSLEGVWDTLIYDGEVKEKLLGYIHSTMLFSDASVDFNIVTWNRVVLLHGPPGTGKTSLCRSLAQKLAIRLSDRYDHGKLIEINSHSLFSKWFSESGKLVQRLFAQVTEMVDDEDCFVVVLIDEVESLTAARAGAMSGKEPSDALRVVNALLTQLDKLKHRKNCLVMTTSNLSSAIDNAFIDRADIKQYIGLPPTAAVYWILQTCLNEIMRAGLVPPVHLSDYNTIQLVRSSETETDTTTVASPPQLPPGDDDDDEEEEERRRAWDASVRLADLAARCQGMSGRTLRRLPVLAHARHLGLVHHHHHEAHARNPRRKGKHGDSTGTGTGTGGGRRSSSRRDRAAPRPPPLEAWLDAMVKCVEEEGDQLDKVLGGGGGAAES
ncbi:hypothetical protein JCM11491_002443 [Sporobolomyces phaffii]